MADTSIEMLVLDTNTVMALWVFEDPALAPLRAAVECGGARIATRDDALEELRRVLAYRQFALPPERQARLLADYARRCARCAMPHSDTAAALPPCRDPDDQKFLEIARDAGATHLITRDKALLRLGKHRLVRTLYFIMSPERFIAGCR